MHFVELVAWRIRQSTEKNTDTPTVVPGHSVNTTSACGKLQEDQEPVK